MAAYYNENDAQMASWLRELIKEGVIAPGEVDERSIEDVLPGDVMRFAQCHFFAGIGVWSYALRCAGWGDDRRVWTGSCPCSPFSSAGKGAGFDDERHLWPAWFWLVSQCRPDVVYGEQVGGVLGKAWFGLVSSDLGGIGYTGDYKILPACGFGAPHIRSRLFFVADAGSRAEQRFSRELSCEKRAQRGRSDNGFGGGGAVGELADATSQRYDGRRASEAGGRPCEPERSRDADGLGYAESDGWIGRQDDGAARRRERTPRQASETGDLADTDGAGRLRQGQAQPEEWGSDSVVAGGSAVVGLGDANGAGLAGWQGERGNDEPECETAERAGDAVLGTGATNGFWRNAEWLYCSDGKCRAVERATESLLKSLADESARDLGFMRVQGGDEEAIIFAPLIAQGRKRQMRLRGYGNAIVASVATEFIKAYMGDALNADCA